MSGRPMRPTRFFIFFVVIMLCCAHGMFCGVVWLRLFSIIEHEKPKHRKMHDSLFFSLHHCHFYAFAETILFIFVVVVPPHHAQNLHHLWGTTVHHPSLPKLQHHSGLLVSSCEWHVLVSHLVLYQPHAHWN